MAKDVNPGAGERCVVVMWNVCCRSCDRFSRCNSGSSECLRISWEYVDSNISGMSFDCS